MNRLKGPLLSTLLELMKVGAAAGYVSISSTQLAARIHQSQQTASQHLVELERRGLAERRRSGSRFAVRVTEKGQDEVHAHYEELKSLIEGKPVEVTMSGKLFQGLGEGAYYIGLPGYKRQFVRLLGFEPFPGTLNLRLDSQLDIETKRRLRLGGGLRVEGFKNGKRTYGGARCFKATVSGKHRAGVLLIERTHYDDQVLELISPVNLRQELRLSEGDEVEVTVQVGKA